MSVWALTLEKSYSIAVRTATERITIVAVTIVCIDKRGILLEQIYACERVLRYTIDRIDQIILEKEIADLKLMLDLLE